MFSYKEDATTGIMLHAFPGRDFRGYSPLLVFPRAPGQTAPPFTPTLFRIDWSSPSVLITDEAWYFMGDGTCVGGTTDTPNVYPVSVVSTLNWVGPFKVK